jgi:hypothetical protein
MLEMTEILAQILNAPDIQQHAEYIIKLINNN